MNKIMKFKTTCLFFIIYAFCALKLHAQTGICTTTPNTSAKLDIYSTNKGFLPPRISLTDALDQSKIPSPATGLLVYCKGDGGLASGYYFWNGSAWATIATAGGSASNNYGDVKTGFQTADHNGWIKLNGRAKSTLSSTQQTQATALGIVSSLPNANNAFLVQNGTAIGSVSSSNTKAITQANLPNVTLGGVTSTDGSHQHTVNVNNNQVVLVSDGAVTSMAEGNSNWTSGAEARSANVIGTAGSHLHTITTNSLNGGVTQTQIDITPKSLSVNTFIYLGY